jgi:hypothetical protein
MLPEKVWRTNIAKPASEVKNSAKDVKISKVVKEEPKAPRDPALMGMPRMDARDDETPADVVNLAKRSGKPQVGGKQQASSAEKAQANAVIGEKEEEEDDDDGEETVLDAVRSREAVRARLEADAAEAKDMAKKRLEAKREKDRVKQFRRIERERESMDPELVQKRKMILETMSGPSAGCVLAHACQHVHAFKIIRQLIYTVCSFQNMCLPCYA